MWRKHSTANNNKENGGEKTAAATPAPAPASAASGNENLPPGWTKKESHSQKGRFYYMSPDGKTQWTPPAPVASSSSVTMSAKAAIAAINGKSKAKAATKEKTPPAKAEVKEKEKEKEKEVAKPKEKEKEAPKAKDPPKAKAKEKGKDKKTKAKTKGKGKSKSEDSSTSSDRGSGSSQVPINWANEVEIEFTDTRLGVTLREVNQMETIPYPQFQAEVDDLPRVNNRAGPAEIYNWSVRPHQRLTLRMRVVAIDNVTVAGLTHREVVERLRKSPRPLKIHFANVEKGTMEEHKGEVDDGSEQIPESASAYLQQKQEFTRVLATGELHTEMWTVENQKLARQLMVRKKKWDTISVEYDRLNTQRVELRREDEELTNDKRKYKRMIEQLSLQESRAVANPEFLQANDLAKKNTEMNEDIAKMSSGNKRLRKERQRLQAALEELELELSKFDKKSDEDETALDEDVTLGLDPNASPSEQLAALRKSRKYMETEIAKEERKAAKVTREMDQLNRHLAKMSRHGSRAGLHSSNSSSDRDRSHREHRSHTHAHDSESQDSVDSSNDGSMINDPQSEAGKLEARIADLRKKQRSVVETLAKAARTGDQDLARDCQKKRKAIRDELRKTQDALIALNASEREASNGNGENGEAARHSAEPASQPSPSSAPSSTRQRLENKATPVVASPAQLASSAMQDEQIPTITGFLKKGPTEWSERNLMRRMKAKRGARERWCEVTFDGFLRYYKRRGDTNVRGEIDLSDSSCEIICQNLLNGEEFVLCTSDQQSHFYTKTPEDLRAWVNTLRAAHEQLMARKHVDAVSNKVAAMEQGVDPAQSDEMYGRATLGF